MRIQIATSILLLAGLLSGPHASPLSATVTTSTAGRSTEQPPANLGTQPITPCPGDIGAMFDGKNCVCPGGYLHQGGRNPEKPCLLNSALADNCTANISQRLTVTEDRLQIEDIKYAAKNSLELLLSLPSEFSSQVTQISVGSCTSSALRQNAASEDMHVVSETTTAGCSPQVRVTVSLSKCIFTSFNQSNAGNNGDMLLVGVFNYTMVELVGDGVTVSFHREIIFERSLQISIPRRLVAESGEIDVGGEESAQITFTADSESTQSNGSVNYTINATTQDPYFLLAGTYQIQERSMPIGSLTVMGSASPISKECKQQVLIALDQPMECGKPQVLRVPTMAVACKNTSIKCTPHQTTFFLHLPPHTCPPEQSGSTTKDQPIAVMPFAQIGKRLVPATLFSTNDVVVFLPKMEGNGMVTLEKVVRYVIGCEPRVLSATVQQGPGSANSMPQAIVKLSDDVTCHQRQATIRFALLYRLTTPTGSHTSPAQVDVDVSDTVAKYGTTGPHVSAVAFPSALPRTIITFHRVTPNQNEGVVLSFLIETSPSHLLADSRAGQIEFVADNAAHSEYDFNQATITIHPNITCLDGQPCTQLVQVLSKRRPNTTCLLDGSYTFRNLPFRCQPGTHSMYPTCTNVTVTMATTITNVDICTKIATDGPINAYVVPIAQVAFDWVGPFSMEMGLGTVEEPKMGIDETNVTVIDSTLHLIGCASEAAQMTVRILRREQDSIRIVVFPTTPKPKCEQATNEILFQASIRLNDTIVSVSQLFLLNENQSGYGDYGVSVTNNRPINANTATTTNKSDSTSMVIKIVCLFGGSMGLIVCLCCIFGYARFMLLPKMRRRHLVKVHLDVPALIDIENANLKTTGNEDSLDLQPKGDYPEKSNRKRSFSEEV